MSTRARSIAFRLVLTLVCALPALAEGPAPRAAGPVRQAPPRHGRGPVWQALIALRSPSPDPNLRLIPARPEEPAGSPPARILAPGCRF